MKKHYLLAIFCIVLGFAACKKNNTRPANPIIGKWYETKLTIHESNGTAVDHDTTFMGNSFTASDYVQFDADKTAAVSQSGIYTITGKGQAISGGTIDVSLINYTYEISDSTLTLMPVLRHPTNGSGGNGMESIVQLDATHLVLRTYYYSPLPFSHSETAYYIKKD
jgi:hypothetical protein